MSGTLEENIMRHVVTASLCPVKVEYPRALASDRVVAHQHEAAVDGPLEN